MTYTATLSISRPICRQTGNIAGWTPTPDSETVAALRRGDEGVFAALLERYHRALLRVALLSISEANQRVLLHRARSKVRQALAAYMALSQ